MSKPHQTTTPGPPGYIYEIVKIWIPTHGVITVYRKPNGEFHIDNGCHLRTTVNSFKTKIKILASHGGVITVTRNKRGEYKLDPEELFHETSQVRVEE